MTSIDQQSTRNHTAFRKDTEMVHIELRLAEIQERHERLRIHRAAERAAFAQARSLRHQLGQSLVRLGRRVGGDAMTAPAWQG
jgi:hypothetical protein